MVLHKKINLYYIIGSKHQITYQMERVKCIMSGGEIIFYLSASCILEF